MIYTILVTFFVKMSNILLKCNKRYGIFNSLFMQKERQINKRNLFEVKRHAILCFEI